ncbi:hypothetical protein ACFVXQ_33350, partial [Kitasatospora sp. NPDC058263]
MPVSGPAGRRRPLRRSAAGPPVRFEEFHRRTGAGIRAISSGRRNSGPTAQACCAPASRVRDGLIVHSRDFHDHLALVVAADALPRLVAARRGRQATGSP